MGLFTAIAARHRGLECLVLERGEPPLDRACGEGLMPPGVMLLRRLGIDLAEDEAPALNGLHFFDGRLSASARFAGEPARGVRRTTLVRRLLEEARQAGAEIRLGTEAPAPQAGADDVRLEIGGEVVLAGALAAADGLRSRTRQLFGPTWEPTRRRFAARRHFACAPWSDGVEVHFATSGVQAFVTPVGPELVDVALLWEGQRAPFGQLLACFPELSARLAGAAPASRVLGAGPFGRRAGSFCSGRMALLGDAALSLDPICGEGLSLGFAGGLALVETVARGEPLEVYARRLARLARPYQALSRLLVELAAHDGLRRRVLSALGEEPRDFSALLTIAAGASMTRALRPGARVQRRAALPRSGRPLRRGARSAPRG